jgi:hypothetical protein
MHSEVVSGILVFKTNIDQDGDVQKIAQELNDCSLIKRWNLDLADIDKVLRIESDHMDVAHIIELVTHAGFVCEELPD